MLDVLYYFTELLKFLCIYVFGFGMQIASNKIRKVWAVVLTILYGAVMTIYKTSNLYPLFYIGYVLLVSYLLIEKFNWKKIRIAVWAICVITGLDTMSFVVTRFLWSWAEVSYMQMQDIFGSMITLSILFFMFYGILRKRNTMLQELSTKYCVAFF